jgi:hypothetical protein
MSWRFIGPVGKIAESGLDQLSGLSYAFKDIQMGLGDLMFLFHAYWRNVLQLSKQPFAE